MQAAVKGRPYLSREVIAVACIIRYVYGAPATVLLACPGFTVRRVPKHVIAGCNLFWPSQRGHQQARPVGPALRHRNHFRSTPKRLEPSRTRIDSPEPSCQVGGLYRTVIPVAHLRRQTASPRYPVGVKRRHDFTLIPLHQYECQIRNFRDSPIFSVRKTESLFW